MAVKGKGKQIAAKSPASASSSSSKRRNQAPVVGGGGRRKRRRSGALQFFDTDAVDADSNESDDEDLDAEDEDLDADFMDHPKAETKDLKGSGKSFSLPFFLKEEELSGDELEELIKDRYGRDSDYVVYDEDPKECEEDPTKDPTIWRVKCMVGRERQIAFCLMQKFVDLQNFGTKLQIISVFSLEHVKGYVYIEADKASDVTEACKGFCNLYSSRMGVVPRNEVPHLFSVRNKACEVSEGTWVRMKSGKYKGDLAQIVAVDDARNRVTIKLVPRIDLQAIAKKFGGGISLKQAAVPSPRLMSSHELEDFRPLIDTRHDRKTGEVFEILDGLKLKNGYLYKRVSIASLVFCGVQPSDSELLKFTESSKDEPEDLNWVSSVYDGSKKMRFAEVSDDKMVAKQENGFELHDLVFFGKKSFGVIIAVEKDGFQILKGDMEGSDVVTVKLHEIKNGCVDKMFKASDRHMKTISLNDTVKVLEGSHEGRQGVVRHMYKGTLFIHDEGQQENSGFFCTKSNLCENIKESRDSCASLGGRSRSSFPQPSMGSSEQEDGTRSFSRHRPSDRDQTFSIGQNLRIRKGPLKGYLCRVVGIYRSDVTVKLDSLVKVLTVQESFLCVPNVRRNEPEAMPSDTFGTQEWQPIGGLSDEGRATSMDKSSWDVGLSSLTSDSWQPFASTAVASNNDNKADQGVDTWGSKVASGARDQEQVADDPWGSKASSGARDQEQGADDPWGSNVASGARDHEQGADDPWGCKAASGARDREQGADDPWGSKASSGARGESDKEQAADEPWATGVASGVRGNSHSNKDVNSWANSISSSGEQNSVWNKTNAAFNDQDGKREKDADGWNGASVKSSTESDKWNKGEIPCVDSGASRGSERFKSADPSSDNLTGSWDRLRTDGSLKSADVTNSWDKAATSTDKGKSADWEQPSSWTCPEVTNVKGESWDIKGKSVMGSEEDNWGKVAGSKNTTQESSDWGNSGKANNINGAAIGGWNKAGSSSQSQTDGWDKPKSFGGDQLSSWNKVDREDTNLNDQRDMWDKPRNFEGGCGFGQGRGRGRNSVGRGNSDQGGDWSKSMGRDGGTGWSWGKERDDIDEAGKNRDKENTWNGGSGGSSWGRGRGRERGRYGGRGSGDQVDGGRGSAWGDSGGGWGSGRGRGRGRNGNFEGTRDDSDDTRPFGRGRGRGRGRFQSSDWNNDYENSGGGGFSRNPVSSWGNDKNSGWGKPTGFGMDEESAGNTSQQGGWNRGKTIGGEQSSNWSKDEGGKSWSTSKSFGGNQSTNWKQETSVAPGGGDSNPSGINLISDWSNREGNNWNTHKASGSTQFSGWDNKSVENEDAANATGKSGSNWDSGTPSDGKRSSGWNDSMTAGTETTGKVADVAEGDWGNKDASKSFDAKQSSNWNNCKSENWNTSNLPHKSSDWDHVPAKNELSEAAAGCDNWNKAKPRSNAQTNEASNWNASKALDGNSSDWKQKSIAGEADKGAGSCEGNWTGQKTYTHVSQISSSNNDGGSSWGKSNSSGFDQPTSWNDRSAGYEERGGNQSEGWNSGRNFGGGKQSSWSENTTNIGRGRGRNFNGGRSSGWNGGAGSDKGTDTSGNQSDTFGSGQSSGWSQGEFTARGRGRGGRNGSWSGGGGRNGNWSEGGRGGRNESWSEGGRGGRDGSWSEGGRGGRNGSWNEGGRGGRSGNWSEGGRGGRNGSWSEGRGRGRGGRGGRHGSWNEGKDLCEDRSSDLYKGQGGSADLAGGWSTGGTADKGSWGGWKSEAGGRGSGWSNQNSGGNKASDGGSSGFHDWDRPKGFNRSTGSGWDSGLGSANKPTTDEGGWNQKKPTSGADDWNASAAPTKETGLSGQQEGGTWGGGNSQKGASSLSQKGRGWNEGSGTANETTAGQSHHWNPKKGSDAVDGSSGWNSSSASAKDDGWGRSTSSRAAASGWD